MEKKIRNKIGRIQKKALMLLLAGFACSLCYSPRKQWRILAEELPAEFSRINHQSLEYGLHRLFKSGHIKMRAIGEGRFEPYLTREGVQCAHKASIEEIVSIPKPKEWDGNFRMVIFDIPESKKGRRDDFRGGLLRLGFREIQKSVLCFPYECGEVVMKMVAVCEVVPYVIYMVVNEISIAEKVKTWFKL